MGFSGHKSFIKVMLISIISVLMSAQLLGCASDSYAAKGAKQGATQGAVSGAVGGLVSALVFGGDPLERAARGAVYGGTVGAVAGGISGSNKDKQVQAQRQAQAKSEQDADLEALKKEIGRPAFNGLAALAECRHDVTLEKARKAQKSENPNYRLAGLWLEVLAYADSRQEEHASSLLPVVVKEDWDIKTQVQAEQAIQEALRELTDIRREFNLPPVCAA
jgi:hypothetical protein